MNTLTIAPKLESRISRAARTITETASQYLSRDAILPEIKQAETSWEYFNPCTIIETVKPQSAGNVFDFIF